MGSSVPPAAALGFVFPHAVLSCPCCCFDTRLASVGIFRLFFLATPRPAAHHLRGGRGAAGRWLCSAPPCAGRDLQKGWGLH